MKVLIVVHPNDFGDYTTRYWCYDILYREKGLLDKITRARKKLTKDSLEYDMPECPYAQKYRKLGWEYFISGDTAHLQEHLEERGMKGEDDLDGLINYLKKRFPNAEVIVER